MTVKWRKSFTKDYKKLTWDKKEAWAKAYRLFLNRPHDMRLRRHKLQGKYKGLESIDVTPDLRALFAVKADKSEIGFYYLRNHNQLYS